MIRHGRKNQNLDYSKRYGNPKKYRKQCAIAHQSTHGLCCVCIVKKSEQLHHAYYGQDVIGESVFPVCLHCHQTICHSSENWIVDKDDKVWKNRNTPKFIDRLKLGYRLLYEGINVL